MIISFILGLIGGVLLLAPLIGLVLDVIKNGKYLTFLGFFGLFLVYFALLMQVIHDIFLSTLLAFSLIPVLFIYIFLMRWIGNRKKKENE